MSNITVKTEFQTLDNPILIEYLKHIKKLNYFGNELKYISMEEVMEILIKLGISVTSLPVTDEKNKIRLLPPIYLESDNFSQSENFESSSTHNNSNLSSIPIPKPKSMSESELMSKVDRLNHENLQSENMNLDSYQSEQRQHFDRSKLDSPSVSSSISSIKNPKSHNSHINVNIPLGNAHNIVYVYELNGEDVVALPDIHKIIRRAQNLIGAVNIFFYKFCIF